MARQAKQSDEAGKRLFSHPRAVADLIRLLGDDWVDDLDLGKLERLPTEHVAEGLQTRRADVSWWAPFKPGAGRPAGAGVLFHIELQSSPDPHMAERLLEYVALQRGDLRRAGWMAADGGRDVAHVPLVVYNGKAKWNAPRLEAPAWVPPELGDLQPRLACRLVDAKNYAGDDAADGNVTRAALALDAASADGVRLALGRAVALYWAADDQELWRSFLAWCRGTLGPSLGGELPALVEDKERNMLAETLRERDELKIEEGRQEGRQEGLQEGRQEGQRALLCSLAGQRFGEAAGAELSGILASVSDGAELARVGALIIGCDTKADFLSRARRP